MASRPSAPPSIQTSGKTSTAASKKSVRLVTPTHDASLKKRMTVEKNVVEELLLVCGVLGTADEETGQLVPVEDCLNWLQDLQRALRRDDDLYRPISLLLGQWKVVEQKLLPLVLSCRYDSALVLTICKILVILTKPLADNTRRAGKHTIKGKKADSLLVQHQISLRENAIQQAETLMDYKRAFCYHPSHIRKQSDDKKSHQEGGVLSVFVSLLAEPLAKQGTSRTESDHLTIELVLHLFRNLLQAEPVVFSSADQVQESHKLHHELLELMDRELVLDIVHVLCADLEQRENTPYNLLLMEFLHHLFRNQDPTAVAKVDAVSTHPTTSQNAPSGRAQASLKLQLSRERLGLEVPTASRHSNFGGTLQTKGRSGERGKYVSTSAGLFTTNANTAAHTPNRRKNKKLDCFVGNAVNLQIHAKASVRTPIGPVAKRAHRTLNHFCKRFVEECYGPVMKNLKNEFRRDSVRLEDNDRVVFFQIVWFFSQWWRSGGQKIITRDTSEDSPSKGIVGQLIFTMDIFTFNMVLNAVDTFHQHKKHARLAPTVALLSEMMHLLHVMYQSKDATENLMALGLMDRLFYNSDPLDRLPKIISKWLPGTSTREHLCDIVEIIHMSMKLLDTSHRMCRDSSDRDNKDTVNKLKHAAANFDVDCYFMKKIISNHSVYMFTQLLSQYASNSPHVNHRIVSFFLRLCKVKIAAPEEESKDDNDMFKNLLQAKTVSLEPMLHNMQFLMVIDIILNDKSIYRDKDYAITLNFCTRMAQDFANLASENPLLFVEALFKHPSPHRFCEQVTNLYVSEELRMLADRDLLLEQQEYFDRQYTEAMAPGEEDAEEMEFDQFAASTSGEAQRIGYAVETEGNKTDVDRQAEGQTDVTARKRVIDSDSSDEEVEFDGNIDKNPSRKKTRHIEDSDEEDD